MRGGFYTRAAIIAAEFLKMKNVLSQPNRRVLVVDDNASIHEDFRKVLKQHTEEVDEFEAAMFGKTDSVSNGNSFDVEFASQGQQGLEKVQRAIAEKRPYARAFM